MDSTTVLHTLRTRWLTIVVAGLLGASAGVAVTALSTPEYKASARLYVTVNGSASTNELVQGSTAAEQKVRSYVNVVTSPKVLDPVIDKLALHESAAELSSRVSASTPAQTVLVDLAVTDSDPERAADITNAIAASLTDIVTSDLERPEGGATTPVRLSIMGKAVAPKDPSNPRPVVNVAIGILLGLASGFTIASARSTLDTRLRERDDVERAADLPILGAVGFDKRASERQLIVADDPGSPRSEAYRRLRTNLQFLDIGSVGRSFVITSSAQGEGKSTTASNLALALAQSGSRVALIDCDLRRPRVAATMGIEGAVGLTDVLIGRLELTEALSPWGTSGLHVLPAGHIPPNPAELLGSTGMKSVLDDLTAAFDVVILDAPPLLPVTDATILAKMTNGALVVTAMYRSREKELAAAVASLRDGGATALGVVMNMVRDKNDGAYRYAYSDATTRRFSLRTKHATKLAEPTSKTTR